LGLKTLFYFRTGALKETDLFKESKISGEKKKKNKKKKKKKKKNTCPRIGRYGRTSERAALAIGNTKGPGRVEESPLLVTKK